MKNIIAYSNIKFYEHSLEFYFTYADGKSERLRADVGTFRDFMLSIGSSSSVAFQPDPSIPGASYQIRAASKTGNVVVTFAHVDGRKQHVLMDNTTAISLANDLLSIALAAGK